MIGAGPFIVMGGAIFLMLGPRIGDCVRSTQRWTPAQRLVQPFVAHAWTALGALKPIASDKVRQSHKPRRGVKLSCSKNSIPCALHSGGSLLVLKPAGVLKLDTIHLKTRHFCSRYQPVLTMAAQGGRILQCHQGREATEMNGPRTVPVRGPVLPHSYSARGITGKIRLRPPW